MPFFHIYLFIFYYKNYEKMKEVPVAKPRNNYYAVLSGRQPGIYKNWADKAADTFSLIQDTLIE